MREIKYQRLINLIKIGSIQKVEFCFVAILTFLIWLNIDQLVIELRLAPLKQWDKDDSSKLIYNNKNYV